MVTVPILKHVYIYTKDNLSFLFYSFILNRYFFLLHTLWVVAFLFFLPGQVMSGVGLTGRHTLMWYRKSVWSGRISITTQLPVTLASGVRSNCWPFASITTQLTGWGGQARDVSTLKVVVKDVLCTKVILATWADRSQIKVNTYFFESPPKKFKKNMLNFDKMASSQWQCPSDNYLERTE